LMPRRFRKLVSERKGMLGSFWKAPFPSPARMQYSWRPVRPETLSPFFEIGIAGFDDFGEAEGAHDFADLDRRHVLREVGHPDAHGGVDGEVFYFGEGLAFGDGGDWGVG